MAPEALDELEAKLDPSARFVVATLRAENAQSAYADKQSNHGYYARTECTGWHARRKATSCHVPATCALHSMKGILIHLWSNFR